MPRSYRYVGPRDLLQLATSPVARCEPQDASELSHWAAEQGSSWPMVLTFVVTQDGALRVSPRHAEHVACAQGQPVLAAGELALDLAKGRLVVLDVTNQSTGYCPEPECFAEVVGALERIGLKPPPELSHAFVFRRCPGCEAIVIVKEDVFECAGCGSELPQWWNLETPTLA